MSIVTQQECAQGLQRSVTPVLVVVDMQTELPHKKVTLANVRNLVSHAAARNYPIVFLEYAGAGDTHPELLLQVKDHSSWEQIIKPRMDGADQVIEVCSPSRRGFDLSQIWVCGIYIDQCVAETVGSLSERLPSSRILVVKEACGTRASKSTEWSWLMFPDRSNVQRTKGQPPAALSYKEKEDKDMVRSGTIGKQQVRLQELTNRYQSIQRRLASKRCSSAQLEYVNRLCLWAQSSLLRAGQFLEHAECLTDPIQFNATKEGDGSGVTSDGARCLTMARSTTDATDLLQLALDEADHARLALIRCRDYLVQAEQALDS